MVCPDKDGFVLAGLVAWGIGCGTESLPGVYASIPDDLCFIHQATRCKHGSKYSGFFYYPQCDDGFNPRSYLDENCIVEDEPFLDIRIGNLK